MALFLTIAGGLLSLAAGILVVVQAVRDRVRQHKLARLESEHERRVGEHDSAYMRHSDARTAWERTGEGEAPDLPFGGIEINEHADQVNAWYAAEYERITGTPIARRRAAESQRDLVSEIFRLLLLPAILASLGVIASTIAGLLSIE